MKKIFLTAIAAASLCFLSACSDDESEPTLEELCAAGLNEDCLVGTWNLNGIETMDGSQVWHNYGTAPSTLVITDDGKFEFTFTTSNVSEMASSDLYLCLVGRMLHTHLLVPAYECCFGK